MCLTTNEKSSGFDQWVSIRELKKQESYHGVVFTFKICVSFVKNVVFMKKHRFHIYNNGMSYHASSW